jgi:hypothetical protein
MRYSARCSGFSWFHWGTRLGAYPLETRGARTSAHSNPCLHRLKSFRPSRTRAAKTTELEGYFPDRLARYTFDVRRYILIFFIALLPVQFVWASAAKYCTHEAATEIQVDGSHLGHHQQVHETASEEPPKSEINDGSTAFSSDADCDYCHNGCIQLLPSLAFAMPVVPQPGHALRHAMPLLGSLPNLIERPNWGLPA